MKKDSYNKLIIIFFCLGGFIKCQAQAQILPQKDWTEFNKHLKTTQKAIEQVDADLIKAEQQVFNAFRQGTKQSLDSAEINFRLAVQNWQQFYFGEKDTVFYNNKRDTLTKHRRK